MEHLISIINTWQFNVIMGLIFSVFYNQFYKLAVTGIKKDGISTVILEVIGGLSLLLIIPFYNFKFNLNLKIFGLFIVSVIFYTITDRIQTTVRKNLEVSIFSIVNQLSKVIMILYGILLFKESVFLIKIIGAGLIIFGNIFLFYKNGKFTINKYIWLSSIGSFCLATAMIIDVNLSQNFNIPFYIMITMLVPGIFNFIFAECTVGDVIQEFNSERKKFYLITGFVWGFVIFFTIRSMQLGKVSFVVPLLATTVLFNVLISSVFQNEKSNLIKKIIAAAIVILGICLTVF